jgi:uncharacterized protein
MAEISASRAFGGYVLKIHSRCNLNCSYCYMYKLADRGWVDQPKTMSLETMQAAMRRLRDHCLRHGRRGVNITLHGGEPLLVGPRHLGALIRAIRWTLAPAGIRAKITIQSNGLLFSDAIGELLREEQVTLGVSLDGLPAVNDRYRVDHRGRPSSPRLAEKLNHIRERFPDIFAGLLCVVDPDGDPVETFEYLESFRPPVINFLLPLDNHDRQPHGKRGSGDTAYGDWLRRAFDHWVESPVATKVLFFNSVINLLCGRPSLTEAHGLDPADLVVVETDGQMEAVDSLKATYEGAARLGLNVHDHDFDQAAGAIALRSREMGLAELCGTCRACPIVRVCGGGDPPTRYSRLNGFDNPSVYCSDLRAIIGHINDVLVRQAAAARGS